MALTERDLNIARKTPQAQKTPTQSKLPRRVPTPNSAPASTNWSSSAGDRVTLVENTTKGAHKILEQNGISSMIHTRKSRNFIAPAADKPLPGEKPLPSRPIARLSNALSPSKDGRCLIDASEEPLHIMSDAGEKHDWPSLTPQSSDSAGTTPTIGSTERSTTNFSVTGSPAPVNRTSLMAAPSTLTDVITGKALNNVDRSLTGSQSSASSYASAEQSSSPVLPASDPGLNVKRSRDPDNTFVAESIQRRDFPARQASLRKRISDGSLVSPSSASSHKFIGFTDFTRARAASPASTGSRQHSPSPASFSRPRPGSMSAGSKTTKTASRIPIADTKKAKVIDVKRNRQSGSSTASPTLGPSFGSRRLASPEALRILENGKVRRQLKRMGPDATVSGARLQRTGTGGSSATVSSSEMPLLSYSLDTSPDGTLAPTSPMATLPNTSCDSFHGTIIREEPVVKEQRQHSIEDCHNMSDAAEQKHETKSEDNGGTIALSHFRPPPGTSPYTMPLQTIPSEAVLPVQDDWEQIGPYNELSRALSHLEGKGSPPKTDVDEQTFLSMFGHFKRGMEQYTQNSATLAENAAAAEKYLAQHPSVPTGEHADSKRADMRENNRKEGKLKGGSKVGSFYKGKRKQTMVSKWSDSTPSDKNVSPTAEAISSGRGVPSIMSRQSTTASKELSSDALSIGRPSLIPARLSTVTADSPNDAADAPVVSRRKSSPTLGQSKQPGSVRAAREGIRITNARFIRTTASAESKRTTKIALPNKKTSSILETSPRGRSSHGGRNQKRQESGAGPKTPRSRSKSRYVLDKINGFFSGKHERKSQSIPPVPAIDESNLKSKPTTKSTPIKISADGSPTKVPQLPKMPSLSPSTHTALRSASPTTPRMDDAATIESSSDSQSVQNLSEHILGKAQRETNPHRKERLLNFAKVLNDSLISAREAQISAETAQHAAKSAQMSYEMTQHSLAMLQRLAVSMARTGLYRKF